MPQARIAGLGSFFPKESVSNVDLYARISGFDAVRARESAEKRGQSNEGLSDAQVFDRWVQQVTGIQARHFFSAADVEPRPGHNDRRNVELMGCYAAEKALADAGIAKEQVDSVVFTTCTTDTLIPNPAVNLSHFLGLGEVATLHTNTACSGFVDALGAARAQILSEQAKCVLVVASEQFRGRLRMDDPTTAILFGDGAAAALVVPSAKSGIRSWWAGSRQSENITMGTVDPLVMGGGPLVQKNAVNAMAHAAEVALERAGVTMADIDAIVPHQANLRILQELARKLSIPDGKMLVLIERTANVSCATIPATLDFWKRGRLSGVVPYKKGSLVLATAVGGGYAYASSVFEL